MIDSHSHPDDAAFSEDGASMLQRAAEQLEGLVAIAGRDWLDAASLPPGLKVWPTVGVHPHQAAPALDGNLLRAAALDPRVIAIGEIGLDYHYDHAPRARQIEVFERQLALAAELALPVSIHCRDAWDDCFAALARYAALTGVFHCFTGGRPQAERALALGWYLSFSGMLTFPKLAPLRDIAAWAPADRLLVETDAPYLAPVPHRGRRNEPAWVWDTARQLAQCRNLTPPEIELLTRENFFRLFPRAACPPQPSRR
ncbi:MAG: TatD family hydrolase [Terriglobales bacterium]